MSLIQQEGPSEAQLEARAIRMLHEHVKPLVYSRGFITKDFYYGYNPDRYKRELYACVRQIIRVTGVTRGRVLDKLLPGVYAFYFSGSGSEEYREHVRNVKEQWSAESKANYQRETEASLRLASAGLLPETFRHLSDEHSTYMQKNEQPMHQSECFRDSEPEPVAESETEWQSNFVQ